MAVLFAVVVGFVLISVLVAAFVGILIINRTRRFMPSRDKNLPFAVNFLPELANGHAFGVETANRIAKNHYHRINFYPIDVHISDDPDHQEPLRPQEFVVGEGYRVSFPKGTLSNRREVVFYLPKDNQNILRRFEGTIFGDALSKGTLLQKLTNMLGEGIREGDVALTTLVRRWGKGQLSRDELDRLSQINKYFAGSVRELQQKAMEIGPPREPRRGET